MRLCAPFLAKKVTFCESKYFNFNMTVEHLGYNNYQQSTDYVNLSIFHRSMQAVEERSLVQRFGKHNEKWPHLSKMEYAGSP